VNGLFDRILDRPKNQKISILAVLIILLVAGYYSLWYGPRSEEINRLSEDVETARTEKTTKQQRVAILPKLQKELHELDIRLKEVVAQLPNKKEMADLLSSISAKAQTSGLEILLFRPRAENFKDFYAEVPVDINVKGDFSNVVTFFDEVGRLARLVNLNNIAFKNPKVTGNHVVLEGASLATTYRFLDEAERKKIAEEKAKAAKEKK
jgi:type IV pilus assembly protein PilO